MQNILVLIAILVAAVYVTLRIYRLFTGQNSGCSCGSDCDSCDLKKEDKEPEEKS